MLNAQFVEIAESLACEVPNLGIVAFGFELGDDDDRQHDGVFGEPEDSLRVGQQNGRIEYIRPFGGAGGAWGAGRS